MTNDSIQLAAQIYLKLIDPHQLRLVTTDEIILSIAPSLAQKSLNLALAFYHQVKLEQNL